MTTGDVKRKLTAIFSADVEGYSRLMEEDELATVETLTSHKETMGKLIRQYRGRVVDSTGDNLLAEFGSVVDAVQCAVEVQQVLSSKNEALPENRRMNFRIGINSGDVIEEDERIYGDGVNVAARVESLAEGGGISISGTAFDQLGKKLPLGYEYVGEQTVKNIRKPVRVYRVLTEEEAVGKVIGEKRPKTKQLRGAAIGGIVVLILVVGALAIWNFHYRPAFEPASVEKMAFPLPDKPSIAVLPFTNMSRDPEQEYFSDGITALIITQLFKIPDMFVIAKSSAFVYKGKAVRVQQVAEELGVRYVLEGSVQRAGDRIRVNAQLIDAITGEQRWAERYDRELKDMFAVQDEIVRNVVTELAVQMTQGEWARRMIHASDNYEAVDYYLRADKELTKFERDANVRGRELLMKAVELDPNYARAIAYLGFTYYYDVIFGWAKSPTESFEQAQKFAERAAATRENDYLGHALLSRIYAYKRNYEESIAAGMRAVEVEPSNSNAMAVLGGTLNYAGRPTEALTILKKAMRHTPYPPSYFYYRMGEANYLSGQYETAITEFQKFLLLQQHGRVARSARQWLIASFMELRREEEARSEVDKFLEQDPKVCIEALISETKRIPWENYAFLDHQIELLRKAGLPESPPLPLPDKPSIAVLPFVNMSGDPEQEYFSDGITEEIITALSKSQRLFVIARESSFYYKGKSINIQTVGRALGVKYVLEGTVRMAEDKVRITAQLIDATTAHHLWAERYDRDLKDIFAIQDEITLKILSSLQVKLTEGEQARMWGKKTKNLDVYLKTMEAISLWEKGTNEGLIRFGQLGQEMVDMAPESVLGYRVLAWYYWGLATFGGKPPQENIAKSFKLAQKALSMDESDADSHALLGSVYLLMRQYEKAIAAGERSVELIPNGAMVHGLLGATLNFAGKPDEAIDHLKQAIRLNPFPASWYFEALGRCYMQKGQYEEALTEFKKALHRAPDASINHMSLAVIYILLNRQEEARAAAKKILDINPNFSVERVSKAMPYKNEADLKLLVDALRQAGLPD